MRDYIKYVGAGFDKFLNSTKNDNFVVSALPIFIIAAVFMATLLTAPMVIISFSTGYYFFTVFFSVAIMFSWYLLINTFYRVGKMDNKQNDKSQRQHESIKDSAEYFEDNKNE